MHSRLAASSFKSFQQIGVLEKPGHWNGDLWMLRVPMLLKTLEDGSTFTMIGQVFRILGILVCKTWCSDVDMRFVASV